MGKYTPTIGLEIHAELKTQTKMFCNSKNDPDEKRPNVNVCPVCLAHPGTLPVINREAVKHVLKMGIAVDGTLADFTEFDRKNYFYPDLPKGYQISQYKYPLVTGGNLKGIEITRIHLEEDTARSVHTGGDFSLVDFNRAGVPLMELVTEPVVKNAVQAVQFAKELQLLLRYLGAGEANMEKGEMRVEANISVSDTETFGTKVEIKNLNSFKVVEKAIAYEINRQSSLLDRGDKVIQETRGWDENKQVTFSQRIKEDSHDYRYFPDPDLPKLKLSEIPEFSKEVLEKELPKLPWVMREQYKKMGSDTDSSQFKINPEYIEMFVADRRYGKLFDDTCNIEGADLFSDSISSSIGTTVAGLVSKYGDGGFKNITPKRLAYVNEMFYEDKISSSGRDDILAYMFEHGGDPGELAEEKGLLQISDEETLNKLILKILKENPSVLEDYKGGKEAALQYLIGQGMKATKGAANPEKLKELFINAI